MSTESGPGIKEGKVLKDKRRGLLPQSQGPNSPTPQAHCILENTPHPLGIGGLKNVHAGEGSPLREGGHLGPFGVGAEALGRGGAEGSHRNLIGGTTNP